MWVYGWEDRLRWYVPRQISASYNRWPESRLGAEMSVNWCLFPPSEAGNSSAKILPEPFLLSFACLGRVAKAVAAARVWGGDGGSCLR